MFAGQWRWVNESPATLLLRCDSTFRFEAPRMGDAMTGSWRLVSGDRISLYPSSAEDLAIQLSIGELNGFDPPPALLRYP